MTSTSRVQAWRRANPGRAAEHKRRERARKRLKAELGWVVAIELLAAISVSLKQVADGLDDATLAAVWPRLVSMQRQVEAHLRAACRQADEDAGAEPGMALSHLDRLLAVTTGNAPRDGRIAS